MEGPVNFTVLPRLARKTPTRILFVVLDGLGGCLGTGPTALQAASHPHLDALAARSALGRTVQVLDGITPGSGPGHLALFGYDPLSVDVGRGLLEALGVGADVGPGDVAIRGNLCSVDAGGRVVDRRAGRIPTAQSRPLFDRLAEAIPALGDVRVEVLPGLQHRFALVLRGPDLGADVEDTDPQETGRPILAAQARNPAAAATAAAADRFTARAREVLTGRTTANAVLLRGFSARPPLPTYQDLARLTGVAIAAYPAYRGVARLLGMDIVDTIQPGCPVRDEVDALCALWGPAHDFYFLHIKGTDSAGEDGDLARKAKVVEEFDAELPRLLDLKPDVIVVTGDHATPAPMRAHSWHPVPTLLHGPYCEPDAEGVFDEEACHRGRLGSRLPATALLRLALANAGKLAKFGA
jgi:2,3-bisphosphoglycerate-independent phosphoglycerate mutase